MFDWFCIGGLAPSGRRGVNGVDRLSKRVSILDGKHTPLAE